MKALIVIDMPKNCAKCKLMYLQGIGESICNAVDWEERPSWCPLRPLPTKADVDNVAFKGKSNAYRQGFISGYNCCVDEISGEW